MLEPFGSPVAERAIAELEGVRWEMESLARTSCLNRLHMHGYLERKQRGMLIHRANHKSASPLYQDRDRHSKGTEPGIFLRAENLSMRALIFRGGSRVNTGRHQRSSSTRLMLCLIETSVNDAAASLFVRA